MTILPIMTLSNNNTIQWQYYSTAGNVVVILLFDRNCLLKSWQIKHLMMHNCFNVILNI